MKRALTMLFALLAPLAIAERAAAAQRFTCNLGALTRAERQRDRELAPLMRAALLERKELPDGYGFRFAPESTRQLSEWTYIIARCCQPLEYRLEIRPQPGGAVWLSEMKVSRAHHPNKKSARVPRTKGR